MSSAILIVWFVPSTVTPVVYVAPKKLNTTAPAVVGFALNVSVVPLTTDSTVVPLGIIPSPDTFSTVNPAWIPVVEATVIVGELALNVVLTFSTLLGAHLPSGNWDKANTWLPFVLSLKSNV